MTDLDTGLDLLRTTGAADHWLAVLVTHHPDRPAPDIAVVNAAPIDHPVHGRPVVAFVGRRGAKLANLRARPQATLVFRAAWEWVAVEGPVELVGPDDPNPAIDNAARTRLLRDIFHAAGGHHPDLAVYDRTMAAERRCAVLLSPARLWSNPPGTAHREPETTP